MFSIAAINESDSGGQWEPLAPTKEAQEFCLSQKYHEGLQKLQAKDYAKARELLEDVLKDPLICRIEVGNTGSDHHLLQLRFLTLKNLAAVFLKQGAEFYENALHCFLQAVELDLNDSVVWNQLGTLSCTMGLLSMSRWAFEQGLLCSPNNWNCMEKLLEVLIAIRDEVACLSVANLILRNWPSHYRALHVKKTIEDAEPVPFAPRGIDLLEPTHVKLKFSNKRKSIDDEIDKEIKKKKGKHNITLQLGEATWTALLDGILKFLTAKNEKVGTTTDNRCEDTDENAEGFAYNRIDVVISPDPLRTVDSSGGKENGPCLNGDSTSPQDGKIAVKEKDVHSDKEHPHERRSTRLERLRSRKSGKDDNESSGKDIANAIAQFLDSFILKGPSTAKETDHSGTANTCPDVFTYTSDHEANDVRQFISKVSKNCGIHHLAHLLLEEVAHLDAHFQDYFLKFMELEKLTRHWGQDRSAFCSLFLAELYYDKALCSADKLTSAEMFSDSSYHLCKVIESVALQLPFDLSAGEMHATCLEVEMKVSKTAGVSSSDTAERKTTEISKGSVNSDQEVPDSMRCDETSECDSSLSSNSAFWIRFFWLSGCLSLSSGCKEKAYSELNISLSLLRSNNTSGSSVQFILLPHCKLVRTLTVDRILREINLIKLDCLLWNNDENIKKVTHTEFMELLPPLLLSTKDAYVGNTSNLSKESEKVISLELSALDVLISACEKAKPMNIQVYLDSHRRKLQILTVAASMVGAVTSQKDKNSCDVDYEEAVDRNWLEMVVEAVKDISRNATKVKSFIDQSENSDRQEGLSSLVLIIANIQSLLLTVVCAAVKMILSRKMSCSGISHHSGLLESSCLVDAAIAFCILQHLDPTVSIKTQVDLIVAVHDLLAEYGLCCAGRDGEGEEGTFLKFAIKHLMALDVKLKSQLNTNGAEEDAVPQSGVAEDVMTDEPSVCDEQDDSQDEEAVTEMEELQSVIDGALDQAFFCLYGLKINPESSSEDDLAVHKNTSRGDYQTKEQCADVFQYILPYARALSKTGLVKLRRVLRAIRKHFPQPPNDILATNAIDNFLDGPDSCEKKLCEIYETSGSREAILHVLFPGERGYEAFQKLLTTSSDPYLEVYGNLYYYISQAEEISATDKYAGFVLKKEGEEFVEQSTNLFKYDLMYNPLRFESWQKLANIYDEEVDLLLNDGSKHINILDWRTNTTLPQRVEMGRRRSRRCLLVSLILAQTSSQQSQIHELLALVYYDSLQNVVPFYDQRSILPTKDSAWMTFCQNSMKHFEKAFALKAEWLHAFYLGKLSEKLEISPAKAFSYYSKAITLNPTAVDPVYRLHASRLKLLYTKGKQNFDVIQVVAEHAFNQSTTEAVLSMFRFERNVQHSSSDKNGSYVADNPKEDRYIEPDLLDKAWHVLYEDCLSALGACVEGDLKHFHKARYMLAQGLYRRGEAGDIEKAKEELSFCFKSARSSFTVYMWEIDGTVRKGRKRNPNVGGSKKNLEVSLSESSRKFITCIRKYVLFYLNLLEKIKDLWTLERAYTYLRTDKRFALCFGDIVPVALGKYLQILTTAIRNPEIRRATGDATLEHLLEKMFGVFMDHVNLWTDISNIPEVNSPELSESNLYSYIHQYIHLLESDVRVDALEGLNEKIRKRFKTPKLSNSNFAKICKHASLAWCRSILIKLASITPLPDSNDPSDQAAALSNGVLLYVDLQPDELLISTPDGPAQFKGLDMNWFETLNRIKNIQIKQTSEDNMEAAVTLMKCTYNFYRESSCGTLPSGVNLYTVLPSQVPAEGLPLAPDAVETLDLSIPRKLLLWVYTLAHGRYTSISAVVKYCEEMKSRSKRGTAAAIAPLISQATAPSAASSAAGVKEKSGQSESGEAEGNTCAPHHEAGGLSTSPGAPEAQKSTIMQSQLSRSSSLKAIEIVQNDDTS